VSSKKAKRVIPPKMTYEEFVKQIYSHTLDWCSNSNEDEELLESYVERLKKEQEEGKRGPI
jgi:hypothetical protein